MNVGKREPNVLFAIKEDLMLQTVRGMLRDYGAGKVQQVRTMEDAYSALHSKNQEWDIFIADASLENAMTVIKKAKPEIDSRVKFLLLMSDPMKEEVMEAVQAGVNDFLASPFAPAVFKEKLDKLLSEPLPSRPIFTTVET